MTMSERGYEITAAFAKLEGLKEVKQRIGGLTKSIEAMGNWAYRSALADALKTVDDMEIELREKLRNEGCKPGLEARKG